MTTNQTAEETALIAKWNAGDYSAEGWVNNTEGLTEEALSGLADYNTKKYFGVDNLIVEEAPEGSEANVVALMQTLANNASASARLSLTYGRVNNVQAVIAVVYHRFTTAFGQFRATFERQGSAGTARINGTVRWTTGAAVSGTYGLAVLENDPTTPRQVVLSATTPGTIPPTARLQFTGPAGTLTWNTRFTGRGRYQA
ncbi:hypothetical protein PHLGIDRAFT_151065 [Phlebiopsis gigantea 11061_1 CR5-6]|uniref:Uncharacterized protein n=1 Tax=Phlebiopsis gigantea (strain 11061_1 CR5-6) TaxID=745531 RepID=A0A0C3RVR3_PHLG1|nr:hypothetical protein PHLGIDRAFT_151065 [Phlebiopsis gigantea 11061_1 CR5-6]